MPIKTNNTYNIDKKFDYFTIKAMVIESLERILLSGKQEQNHQGQQQQPTIASDYKALAAEEDDDDEQNEIDYDDSESIAPQQYSHRHLEQQQQPIS